MNAHPYAVTPACANQNIKHPAVEDSDLELLESDSDVKIIQAVWAGCEVEVVNDEL